MCPYSGCRISVQQLVNPETRSGTKTPLLTCSTNDCVIIWVEIQNWPFHVHLINIYAVPITIVLHTQLWCVWNTHHNCVKCIHNCDVWNMNSFSTHCISTVGFKSAVESAKVAISLYQLTVTSAIGAAVMGTQCIPDCKLPIDYNSNKKLLCHFE